MDATVREISNRKQARSLPKPIVATPDVSDAKLLSLMRQHKILHIPIVDSQQRIVGLKLMRDLVADIDPEVEALVMAGGFGTRLLPLTQDIPKPMLPVAGRPILEHIIDQLRSADICKVVLATHYLPEQIHDHFGEGQKFGVDIEYVHEEIPLGTAGALGLLHRVEKPLLVMNGDIMTHVDFRAMLAFHKEHEADITVGVARYKFQVPYGVVECNGSHIVGLNEKPEVAVFVSAGIYLLSPSMMKHVPKGKHLDMPDLINLIAKGKGVAVSFPIVEYWLDVGAPAEYEKAKRDYAYL